MGRTTGTALGISLVNPEDKGAIETLLQLIAVPDT